MSELEDLRAEKEVAYQKILKTSNKLFHARQFLHMLEERYCNERREYEGIDRHLAVIDGRHRIVEMRKGKKRSETCEEIIGKLDRDKLKRIAQILGHDLEEGETCEIKTENSNTME